MCFTHENNNFRDKFPPEAAGRRKGHIFHDGFPPEGAPLLKASAGTTHLPPSVWATTNRI